MTGKITARRLALLPLRLEPGSDLKQALEDAVRREGIEAGFVIAGIGSLAMAALRFAGRRAPDRLQGPFEIVTLQGSLSPDGCHLHLSISDADGAVYGGHLAPGCTIYTTAEILVARTPDHRFSRELDPATGHRELRVENAESIRR